MAKSVSLNVRVPKHLDDAIEVAAERRCVSKAAYVKATLLAQLERDGAIQVATSSGGGDLANAATELEHAGRAFESAIGAIGRVASILKRGSGE